MIQTVLPMEMAAAVSVQEELDAWDPRLSGADVPAENKERLQMMMRRARCSPAR